MPHLRVTITTVYPLVCCDILQVMKNQEAVDLVKPIKDPRAAAKRLTTEALARKSKDDISCIVIRFG
jgi:protein phosphatase 1L